MYYLYYAGMAADRTTEQIGMAVSRDGIRFERFNRTGLLLRCEPGSTWKNTRVCNPTVVKFRDEWLMFYQGAQTMSTSGITTHAIGVARSPDGLVWHTDPDPILSFEHMRAIRPGQIGPDASGGVIEPAILVEPDRLTMWFLFYSGSYRAGTTLHCATSRDGREWSIAGGWILSSRQFGSCTVHYPQIVRSPSGLMLWFTVRDYTTAACAICCMTLDGGRPDNLSQILPPSPGGLRLAVRQALVIELNGRRPRGVAALNLIACRLRDGGRNYFGYAHSHLLDSEDASPRLYYHAYHYDASTRGPWMDIGSCDWNGGRISEPHAVGLARSPDPNAWDAYFVADPFVVQVGAA